MVGFFVLSGFVMYFHYGKYSIADYHSEPKGYKFFFVNRALRLYPLWILVLFLDLILWARSSYSIQDYASAFPFFVTLTQSWIYMPLENFSLIYSLGIGSSLGWSISVEWFFYCIFPLLAFIVSKFNSVRVLSFSIFSIALLYFFSSWFIIGQAFDEQSTAYSLIKKDSNLVFLSSWQDSFGRWLVYFNPYLWSFCFVLGVFTAKYFLLTLSLKSNLLKVKIAKYFGYFLLVLCLINSEVYTFFEPLRIFRFGAVYVIPIILILVANCKISLKHKTPVKFRFLLTAGDSSYALYLFHFPILMILKDWHDPVLAASDLGALYEILRFITVLCVVHLFATAINNYVDIPIRKKLKEYLA